LADIQLLSRSFIIARKTKQLEEESALLLSAGLRPQLIAQTRDGFVQLFGLEESSGFIVAQSHCEPKAYAGDKLP